MKFLIDMNLSPTWVPALATHGIEAVHWIEVGKPNAPDKEIFNKAQSKIMSCLPMIWILAIY